MRVARVVPLTLSRAQTVPANAMGTALGGLLYRKLFPLDARECESNWKHFPEPIMRSEP